MEREKGLILNTIEVQQKIKRIAYQIHERNLKEKDLVVAGIYDKGYKLAQLIYEELQLISKSNLILVKVSLDKKSPLQSEIMLDKDIKELKNKTVILVDDVLNTGRTVVYSLRPFLTSAFKKIQTAFLIERNHRLFPVYADYVGMSLATTLKDHVEVSLDTKKDMKVVIL